MSDQPSSSSDRRSFLKASGVAGVGFMTSTAAAQDAKAAGDTVNIALVGCGGRGTGAVGDNMTINKNVRLVAVADVDESKFRRVKRFADRFGDRNALAESKMHAGLDGYKKVLDDKDVDLVLFATPPGFRPSHIAEAVKAGKHVFAEKPSCVDVAGYHACYAAHDEALKNKTAIVTGTQYRRQNNYIEGVKKIREGAIGDVVSATARYCSRGIWYRGRRPDMSDVQYQIHNWMHFIWLSGDQIAEQAVHNIDALNWVMDSPPVAAYGSGGRFTRPDDSEMWDNVSIDYEYPGGKIVSFMCRQIPGTRGDNGNVIYGTKGTMYIAAMSGGTHIVDRDGKETWSAKGNIGDAYRQEHKDLVDSIVAGKPIVELKQTTDSSLTAIMGRIAGYTGQRVTWDFLTKESKLDLMPKELKFDGTLPPPAFAVPGKTKLV
ncbi:MAG: Gfo/Idh/MocA family oxidoreductase [Pirellulales bacterium]|nr:Gfo/Idh/MocA family oxidoreductase [Pirellulales bacterium]